jgi:MGT family glycosyltransferase
MKKQLNFLFVTLEGGGNTPPVLGLARRLSTRGHNVRVLTEPCLENAVSDQGLEFIAFERHFTRKDRKEDLFKDSNVSPFSDPSMDNIVFGPAKTVVEETLRAIQQAPTDILIVDCLLPPALIAAEMKKIPAVILFHFPEYMPGPNRPPGMLGLLPGKNFLGRTRDRILTWLFHRMLNKYLPLLNDVRKTYNLEKLENTAGLVERTDLRIIQTLRRFDFPIEPAPQNVRYTGPVLDDPDWAGPWINPWPEDDKRPLVVISLSSTFQNQRKAIQSAIDALKGLDVRGLVTLGMAIENENFEIPQNVVVLKSAPHSQVFPLADLVITHAGHGTIMRALANGLPLICLPMGRDQNDNAAKVEYHGCGIKLNPGSDAQKIRKAICKLLETPEYRQNAARFQHELLSDAPMERILIELESLVPSALPVPNTLT